MHLGEDSLGRLKRDDMEGDTLFILEIEEALANKVEDFVGIIQV